MPPAARRLLLTSVLAASVGGLLSGPAMAASPPRVFANCTAMHQVYKGGVAKPGAINRGGQTRYVPRYDARLYAANTKSDRDRDGIACEA